MQPEIFLTHVITWYKVGAALREKIIYICLCAGRQKHNLCRNRMSLFYSQQVNVDV